MAPDQPGEPAVDPLPEAEATAASYPAVRRRRAWPVRLLRWVGFAVLALVLLLAGTVGFLHTPPGRQFIVDQIAKVAPASGLSVRVGAISGSVLWSSTLLDVEFRDAEGQLFLTVPEVDLDWRPITFLFGGLDVRQLVLRGGTLQLAPRLVPGDPDAPILPDFDISIDRFVIEDLTVSESFLGQQRVIDFRASAEVREGLVDLEATGDLGGGDLFDLTLLAEPDGNRFDMDFDYRAPVGGLLAGLIGTREDLRVRLGGDGTWQQWNGRLLVDQAADRIGNFRIVNQAGRYTVSGNARPGDYVSGTVAAALGERVTLGAVGTLQDRVLRGALALRGAGVRGSLDGTVDLRDNLFDAVRLRLALTNPRLFGGDLVIDDARLNATLNGPFRRSLEVPHELTISRMTIDDTVFMALAQRGTLTWDGTRTVVPLNATVARLVSGIGMVDPRLVGGRLGGTLVLTGDRLVSDRLALTFPGMTAQLALQGDLGRNSWRLRGPVRASGLMLPDMGTLDGSADIDFTTVSNRPWTLSAAFRGTMPRVTNGTLSTLAGTDIRFAGSATLGAGRPINFSRTTLNASKLALTVDGRLDGDTTTLAGNGRHVDFGEFTVDASIAGDGPRAELVFAQPYPPAGLRDVRVALEPEGDSFRIATSGQSTLGPFDGTLLLTAAEDGPLAIAIERLDVWQTSVTGALALDDAGVSGDLLLAGGGVDGTVALAPREGGQGFDVTLTARNARFAGATPLGIREAEVQASGVTGSGGTTVTGNLRGAGISYGSLFVGRIAARAEVQDGRGTFNASLTGRRGSRFELQLAGDAAPDRISLAARGSYGQRRIAMPRRAVLLATEDGGWQLQQTQLSFGGGFVIAEGRFGGEAPVQARLALAELPLSLADVALGDLSLGGTISGIVDLGVGPNDVPVGDARVMVRGLTRSGLLLVSRPVDVALVARLTPDVLQTRAVIREGTTVRGRLQGRIAGLPQAGGLAERLNAGDLFAQVRFEGPADALWRLTGVELIDLTGTVQVAADIRGSLRQPQVAGSLAGDALRLRSQLTGTDIRQVRARGRFAGSRLQITSFAGTTRGEGAVSGSGFVDLANLGVGRGPQIDLRIAARRAQILNLPTMGATVTGPLRIVSSGVGGTIAGRLRVNQARWALGVADEVAQLPNIPTREINLPADIAPARAASAPWRYLIDAVAPGVVEVDGMGLDSEWSANVRLRGTTEDPRVGGSATVVPRQGFYDFAGVRFDLTRGQIDFDEAAPIDPRLDILAETTVDDLTVAVTIGGRSSQPEITFNSTPSLPEEELLARLLFGGSITELSATDALQLGAAVASLRGGGGMDPINRLRTAIGLDRLRLVPADPALDRGTAIALGKNFGRRIAAEIITDGRGYNATEVEFRVTSWLSLLASINTLGRASGAAEYRKDY
jgi:translocation and assembly module TamB